MPRLEDIIQSLGDFLYPQLTIRIFQVESSQIISLHCFHYKFRSVHVQRMAQGICNSPLTFQRLMNSVISRLLGKNVFCFLNDIIISSKDSKEHYSIFPQVLSRFESAGLKIKLIKCAPLRKEVKFFSQRIDRAGIHTLDCKIQAIQTRSYNFSVYLDSTANLFRIRV